MKVVRLTFVLAISMISIATATTQENVDDQRPTASLSLRKALQRLDDSKSTRYVVIFRDLNGDGRPEAIVFLTGRRWCGSGGCTALVLRERDADWSIVTKITVVHPPIRVL